jgi:hypothetical protein
MDGASARFRIVGLGVIPAQPDTRTKNRKHDRDAAEGSQLQPIRGNAARTFRTKEW